MCKKKGGHPSVTASGSREPLIRVYFNYSQSVNFSNIKSYQRVFIRKQSADLADIVHRVFVDLLE
jgi:hypothetical protein